MKRWADFFKISCCKKADDSGILQEVGKAENIETIEAQKVIYDIKLPAELQGSHCHTLIAPPISALIKQKRPLYSNLTLVHGKKLYPLFLISPN